MHFCSLKQRNIIHQNSSIKFIQSLLCVCVKMSYFYFPYFGKKKKKMFSPCYNVIAFIDCLSTFFLINLFNIFYFP